MFKKKELAENIGAEEKDGKEVNSSAMTEEEREKLILEWQRDAEQLKIIVPEFDLAQAVKDESFKEALINGATVFEAYAKTLKMPKAEPREEIAQNARLPRRGTGTGIINPAKLSSKEFKKYIDNIKGV